VLCRSPGETEELDAWPEAVAALAATRAASASALPPPAHSLPLADWATRLLRRVTIALVPIEARMRYIQRGSAYIHALNLTRCEPPTQVPAARRAVENGQLCRRKSLAEVDLNRNWASAWRAGAPRGGDEFGGAKPFSEPQSRALRDLATTLRPTAYANVHSGEWAIYVPWDHKKARRTARRTVPNEARALTLRLCRPGAGDWAAAGHGGAHRDAEHALQGAQAQAQAGEHTRARARADVCHSSHAQCTRGAGGAASNYLAFGTSMDWMWQGALLRGCMHSPPSYPLNFPI
jgi:hypothetical protein